MHEALLNIESKEIRYAHLKNGQLDALVIERKHKRQLTGNIYRGSVLNILENIQSAFIDIDEGENGFIHISDMEKNVENLSKFYDIDEEAIKEAPKKSSISEMMKPGLPALVQVVKEPIGTKGARLTANVSIAGRYLVLLPNSAHKGVSRKIENRSVRERLKRLIRSFELPQDMGLICRTASSIATDDMLITEANELLETWNEVLDRYNNTSKPTLLYEESDILKRTILTAVDKRFDRILIDDYPTYQRCKKMYAKYEKEHPLKIEFYRDKFPMFERFNVEKEIEKSLRRKIWLPTGGYLFIEKTEAMHTIDVNSGRSKEGGKNVEETLVQINLEAAEEIARQLRLRNLGGLIICDFIDMRYRKNQRRILDRLKEEMKGDTSKNTILSMSDFGLVEMTRQRSRGSLEQIYFTSCPYCNGAGLIKTHETLSIEIERALKKGIECYQQFALRLVVHPSLYEYLVLEDVEYLKEIAEERNAMLTIDTDDTLHLNDFHFYSTINKQKLEF
ncbi:MAG: Rne/Rng family ribonuclease [Waddliaceae bacterium]